MSDVSWAWAGVCAIWGYTIGWYLREWLLSKKPPTIEHFLGEQLLETYDDCQAMNKFAGDAALAGKINFTRNEKRIVCTITDAKP